MDIASLDPTACATYRSMHCTIPDANACAGHVLAKCELSGEAWEVETDFYCNPPDCPTVAALGTSCSGTAACAYRVETPCGVQDAIWQCTDGEMAPTVVPLCS